MAASKKSKKSKTAKAAKRRPGAGKRKGLSTRRLARGELRLLADIGGTTVRFALQRRGRNPSSLLRLPCADFRRFEDALDDFLAKCGERPNAAGLAVAAIPGSDRIAMTNNPWMFSARSLRRRYGFERLAIVNDFAALARSVPKLRGADIRVVGGGKAIGGEPVAVIGPGTGLGVAGLIPAAPPILISGEGGHVTLEPANDRESEILGLLRKRFGHVSAERVLSGPGLVSLFAAICALEGEEAPRATASGIVRRALDGSSAFCAETLAVFCAMLGTAAADAALTLGARGGVFIGGGIVPKLGDHFSASPFRRRFESKGRFSDYLAAIPTFVIVRDDAALVGLAALLDDGPR